MKADSVPLPRRSRKKNAMAPQTPEETAEVDPEVIKRLLSGLSNGGLD